MGSGVSQPISQPDSEPGHQRDGYPSLAAWIANDEDGEGFIFRRFNRMSARHLLHLQCQLTELEHEIDQLDEQARLDRSERISSRRWESMVEKAAGPNNPETKRIETAEKLGQKLKEYRKHSQFDMAVISAKVDILLLPR
jgi:hypothetical protein